MQVTFQEPWLSFLRDVDRALSQRVEVHCLGGFVLTVLWGHPRTTGDVDIIEVEPSIATAELLRIAGESGDLSKRYHLQFHEVTIAEYPELYVSRLVDITPQELRRLRLLALEAHDLALTKLARNSPRDREDVRFLVGKAAIHRRTLQERFEAELRPYLLHEERDARTMALWLDEFFPT